MCHIQAVFHTPGKCHSLRPKHCRIRFLAHATIMADARKNPKHCYRIRSVVGGFQNTFLDPTGAAKIFRTLEVLGSFEKCTLLFRKSRHKKNLESTSEYGFFPRFGEKWRPSEYANASYPGLSFHPPGSAPIGGVKEGEFRDWTKPRAK